VIDPDGKNEKTVNPNGEQVQFHPFGARLSPDGKLLAVQVVGPLPPDDGTREAKPVVPVLHIRGIGEKEPGISLGVECRTFAWSPDGTEIACTEIGDGPRDKPLPPATHYTVNVKTKAKTKLDLPADHVITDWSRDGKFLVTTSIKPGKDGQPAGVHLFTRTGTAHKTVIDGQPFGPFGPFGRLSPDGKQLLLLLSVPNKEGAPKDARPRQELTIADVATGKTMKVEDVPLNGEVLAYCWSPDGKKIAYTWREVGAEEVESHLIVCDADGKNQKTIASAKERNQPIAFGQVDWR
jgi:Tol biopolymer transport system component